VRLKESFTTHIKDAPAHSPMKKVVVFGGRGFLGRAVCAAVKEYFDVSTFDRSKGGQYTGSITDSRAVAAAIKGKDLVINLVGLSPLRKPPLPYQRIHVDGVKNILDACKQHHARLIHISALGADPKGATEYLRTKGRAELLIARAGLSAVIIRPSIIIDRESELLQMLWKSAPLLLFPRFTAKVQPIARQDLAQLIALAARGKVHKKMLSAAGPEELTLYEIARNIHARRGCWTIPLPLLLFRTLFKLLACLGLFGLGQDQVVQLTLENVTDRNDAATYLQLHSLHDVLA